MIKHLNNFLLSVSRMTSRRLLLSAFIALVILFALNLAVQFSLMGLFPEGYVLRNRWDSDAHASWSLASAHYLPQDTTPVYVFGGSGMREALVSEDAATEILNSRSTDKHYKVFQLSTLFRTPANDLSMLDMMPDKPGIIIYGLSFTRFSFGKAQFMMQVNGLRAMGRNKAFLDFMEGHYPDVLEVNPLREVISADTYLFPATRLLVEKVRDLNFTPIAYKQHKYHKRIKDENLDNQLKSWKENSLDDDVPKYFEMNRDLLKLFIERARARGHQILLVEQPMDYEYIAGRLDKTFDFYRPKIRQLAIDAGANYTDFEKDLGFQSGVFGDLQHMKDNDARRRFTGTLMSEVIQLQAQERK